MSGQSLLITQAADGQRHVNTQEVMHCNKYFNSSICLVLEENKGKDLCLEGWIGVLHAG